MHFLVEFRFIDLASAASWVYFTGATEMIQIECFTRKNSRYKEYPVSVVHLTSNMYFANENNFSITFLEIRARSYKHFNWNMRSEMWLAIDSQCANKMCIAWILSTPFRKAVLELLKSDISNAENRLFENKYANRAFCQRKWVGER